MLELVWLIPALPLVGFAVLTLAGRRFGEPAAGWLATLLLGGSFAASIAVYFGLVDLPGEERVFSQVLFEWFPAGGLTVDVGFLVDPLSVTMALFITGVATLIHLYSIGYMHGDGDFARFFALLNLFVFFMLMLVFGDSLLLTFLGWEGVGLCSYQLISFWFAEMPNAVAGKKAFVTNRIGDWGFLVAMLFVFATVGSLNYTDLNANVSTMATTTATAIAALLFIGAVGKSAQFPLFVWLPDAMAGPTPVSALIHAATMVTVGVFLMIRVNPVLAASSDWVPDLIAWVGVGTALLAATIAVSQNDIKKVLAYSTISQLGYTFLAIGSGAYVAALFHVVTHAFFKALLFLGSGSVIHGMHGEQDMRWMGALRKVMPITAVTFIVGWLAIAGVPPFAGFWSKDEILAHAFDNSPALWALGLFTALLTAYYMSRQVFLVFYGEARWNDPRPGEDEDHPAHDVHPHESPWTMTVPLVVLAGLAVVGGLMNMPFADETKAFEHWLEPVVAGAEAHLSLSGGVQVVLAVIAVLGSLLGIGLAVMVYLRKRLPVVEPEVLARGWYIDETVARAVDGPGEAAFEGAATFDRVVIDGAVNETGTLVKGLGSRLRTVQTGYVRNYALVIAFGTVALLVYVVTRLAVVSVVLASSGSGALEFPILTVLVVLPAAGALLVGLLSRTRPELVKATAVLVSLTAAALGGWMLVEFQTGEPGFQFVSRHSWIADLGISWHVGVDGISLFLVVLTLFLFPIALLATDPGHDAKPYYAWLLVLEAGCLGTFLALDLFLFFVMFEIVLVPMYFLIGGWGHGRRVYAAVKFFLYTMLGSAMMLVGILTLVFLTSSATGNPITFDLVELANTQALAVNTARWVFLAFALAFAVKVPLFPLHTWLPDAHTEAPTAGSVILAGVMLKLGTYGFLRFGLYLFPEAAVWFAPAMVTLGVIGILYAAVVATVQKDLKRLVAYSSVAHLGFIVLGTFAFTTQGLSGSVLQMVNHGLSTGALFLLVGLIYERRHTRQIAELGGLQKPAPILAFVFTVVMLSSIGLPGLNGFVGEFLILIGSFLTRQWWAVVGALGVIVAALYLLWAYQRVFHGPAEGENAEMADMNRWELAYMAPLLAAIVFLGVYPKPVLERIEPAVNELIVHLEEFSDYRQPDTATQGPQAPTPAETVEEEHGMIVLLAQLDAPEPVETPDIVWSALLPLVCLTLGAVLLILLASLLKDRLFKGFDAAFTILTAGTAIAAAVYLWQRIGDEGPSATAAGAVAVDGFGVFLTVVICAAVILAALVSDHYVRREELDGPEYFVLMLLSAAGGVTMAIANDLIVVFLGLEVLSIAAYVLAAMQRHRSESQEAGMKYFVLGAFSSAIFLYGIAFVYGATGSTNLSKVGTFLAENTLLDDGTLLLGLMLLLVGLGFKVAAVPFHQWSPDVYQGAPSPAVSYMAGAVKAAAFASLLRIFVTTFDQWAVDWQPVVYTLAVLSLIVGAVLAAVQTDVKRMMAYSSVNHAGFILLGVQAASAEGTTAVLFYVGTYAAIVAGTFGVITIVAGSRDARTTIDDYKGLSGRRPTLALAFTVLLLAQAGVPLTAGFFAKFEVVLAAVEANSYWLAVIAMATAVVTAFVYLRVIVAMYMADEDGAESPARETVPWSAGVGVGLAVGITLLLGILPWILLDVAEKAVPVLVAAG